MIYSHEVEQMCKVAQGVNHGAAPIPEEAKWVQSKEIKDISGLTHGIGWCAPQQGACKLTLNVKEGIIQEALVETIGCSGMTHSAAMAAEILPGRTILEALNTDLVCDAINTAMTLPFFRHCWRKARQKDEEYDRSVSDMVQAQQFVESQKAGPDPAAEPTARYLSLTCEALSNDPSQKRVLSRFGYLLGRYVYLSDALDDLEKDEKKNRFNPFLQSHSVCELKSLSYSPAVESLYGTIAELEKAFALLKLNDWQPILENIIYFGLKQSLQNILHKKEKNA